MTTSPITTITDELLAEIESEASMATAGKWGAVDSPVGEIYIEGECNEFIAGAIDHVHDANFIALASPGTMLAIITELRTLRAENAALAKDAERFRLFAETVVAEFNEKQLTPPQRALFTVMNSREEVSDVADLAAMFDAAMQESAK